jgi:hypothetical protein
MFMFTWEKAEKEHASPFQGRNNLEVHGSTPRPHAKAANGAVAEWMRIS